MRSYYFLCLFFVCLTYASVSVAQSGFTDGYVITTAGDTLHGEIDYKNWIVNPRTIAFRAGGRTENYTPFNIHSFVVRGKYYVGATVEAEKSPVEIVDLNYDPELKIETETVFLLTLFTGDKSLYQFTDEEFRENFYIATEEGYTLLGYKKYLDKQDFKYVQRENRLFVKQLHEYLNDCPDILNYLKTVRYDRISLTKLFGRYYKCVGRSPDREQVVDRGRRYLGITGGYVNTGLRFKSATSPFLDGAEFIASNDYAFGLTYQLVLPNTRGKWRVHNDLLYTIYEVTGYHLDYRSDQDFIERDYTIGLSYIKGSTSLRMQQPLAGAVDFYIGGGFSVAMATSEVNEQDKRTVLFTQDRTEMLPALGDIRRYELGLLVTAGLQLGAISFDTKFEMGSGMSDFGGVNSTTTRLYLLLGYHF